MIFLIHFCPISGYNCILWFGSHHNVAVLIEDINICPISGYDCILRFGSHRHVAVWIFNWNFSVGHRRRVIMICLAEREKTFQINQHFMDATWYYKAVSEFTEIITFLKLKECCLSFQFVGMVYLEYSETLLKWSWYFENRLIYINDHG